jgi:hypothetical protein
MGENNDNPLNNSEDNLEKERMERERLEKEKLEQERLEQERIERERQEQFRKQDRLISNNMIFIIPSWGDLLGYPTLGKYVGHDVEKIITDIVIFFAGAECAVETENGTMYFIFGLGFYYTKFELAHDVELSRGKYIIDNRLLTGLVLSDFVYDHLASSKVLTLEDDKDVIIAEKVIKVPIDLSFKTEGRRTLIKGAIMRNLFIPHKDIFLEFMDKIRSGEGFNLDLNGHMLLSACRDYFNKIIVSERMKFSSPGAYLSPTAGIDEFTESSDDFLINVLSPIELQKIKNVITNLKNKYAKLKYDPIYPYSILENVSRILKSESPPISLLESSLSLTSHSKKSILYSAINRLNSFVEWPNDFPRKIKEKIEVRPTLIESDEVPHPEPKASFLDHSAPSSIPDYREPPKEEKEFKLRIEKSENVQIKPLPLPPADNIENILLYVKSIIDQNYDMPSIGRALGLARDGIKNLHPVEFSTIKWELSKWANIYEKKAMFRALPLRDKETLLEGVGKWLKQFEEERLERERKEREEKERIERERLERERKERERIEQERIEKERQRLEEEREEREKLAALREEQERIKIQREQEMIEAERQEKLRLEQERIEKERQEREFLEREKAELKELKAKKKKQAKLLKKKRKEEKKLAKQKAKLAKKKAKEKEKLAKLKEELDTLEE